jgi:hypothetical protein
MFRPARSPLRSAIVMDRSGGTISISFDGITRIHNVQVIGNPAFLRVGQHVPLLCVDNYPVAFALNDWSSLPPMIDGEILIPTGDGKSIALHNPLTLDSEAIRNIFDIELQRLDLDSQAANTFLGGPSGGSAAKPYFRSILLADLPDITLNNLVNVEAPTPANGDTLVFNSATNKWEPGASSNTRQSILTVAGDLEVAVNPLRIYNLLGVDQTVELVFASVGTAPTGASVAVSLLQNGAAFQTVSIAATANTGTTGAITGTWTAGNYLTISVTGIGSTLPGSDLTVHIVHS